MGCFSPGCMKAVAGTGIAVVASFCMLASVSYNHSGKAIPPRTQAPATPAQPADPYRASQPEDPYRTWCDPQIPKYDLQEWAKSHGEHVVPDHPAIFTGDIPREGYRTYAGLERFLKDVGRVKVETKPEYAEAGGHLAIIAGGSKRKLFRTLNDMARTWNQSHYYYSDFKCSPACETVKKTLGTPSLFQAVRDVSQNFLVGGFESGLPFHKHKKTWQGLVSGRKGWYLVPPGSMSEELYNSTGPYIIPVRGYHKAMQRRRLGERPLYCVQSPGEILYIPDHWWHATLNLDAYQLAWGGKPCCMKELESEVKRAILTLLPESAFDTEGDCGDICYKGTSPNAFYTQAKHFLGCRTTVEAFGATLKRMEDVARRGDAPEAVLEATAAAHCFVEREVGRFIHPWLRQCNKTAATSLHSREDIQDFIGKWGATARNLSARIAAMEC